MRADALSQLALRLGDRVGAGAPCSAAARCAVAIARDSRCIPASRAQLVWQRHHARQRAQRVRDAWMASDDGVSGVGTQRGAQVELLGFGPLGTEALLHRHLDRHRRGG
eukprot:43895-Chlamydomonas_euryale.AAC.11